MALTSQHDSNYQLHVTQKRWLLLCSLKTSSMDLSWSVCCIIVISARWSLQPLPSF